MQQVRREYEDIVAQLQPLTEESVHWPARVGLCYPQFQPSQLQDTEMGSQVCADGAAPSSEAVVRDKIKESEAILLDDTKKCSAEHESVCEDEISAPIPNEDMVMRDESNASLVSDQGMAKMDELDCTPHTPDEHHDVLDLTCNEQDTSPEEDNQLGSAGSSPPKEVAISDVVEGLSLGNDESTEGTVPSEQRQCSTGIPHHDASGQDRQTDNDVFKILHTDRASLLELRSKLGMELMWLKQAIASRQKVFNRVQNRVQISSVHYFYLVHSA